MLDAQAFLRAARKFTETSILVLGDMMLDNYIHGDVSRISPEAPVPVVLIEKETMHLGGAANVANNLGAFGCQVFLAGAVGDDPAGYQFMRMIESRGMDMRGLIRTNRPTTTKTRIIARGQQMLRVDKEENVPLDEKTQEALLSSVMDILSSVQGIIVSDYAKGVITESLLSLVIEEANKKSIPVFVDPKPVNKLCYKFASFITPNQAEAEQMTGQKIVDNATLEKTARAIKKELSCRAVLVTRGAQGMGLIDGKRRLFPIDTFAREIFDVSGAGDTVISSFALSVISGLDPRQAAFVSNIAAGIVVRKLGTATATTGEILEALQNR